ncbi:MAG: hypothetical protein LBC04_02415 [Holosporaceae bacterium]|jgi:ABC-type antimicrobial peptide transport system ATPase subunit|nr:hypothetical protein [Holosporaceae bacterium]
MRCWGILRSPEIVINVERIAELEAAKGDGNAASSEITKQNLIIALKNLIEVWSFLYPTEQQKIAKMFMDEVVVGDEGDQDTDGSGGG